MAEILGKELTLARQLDSLKNQLVQRFDYNSHQAFLAIDRHNSGAIDQCSLSSFVRAHGVYLSEAELF